MYRTPLRVAKACVWSRGTQQVSAMGVHNVEMMRGFMPVGWRLESRVTLG